MTKQHLAAICSICVCAVMARADDGPKHSLDGLQHPYRHIPLSGHASYHPGSPKWFVPGYGYRVPGFAIQTGRYAGLNPYMDGYVRGVKQPRLQSRETHFNWSVYTSTPWYLPGSPTNARRRFHW